MKRLRRSRWKAGDLLALSTYLGYEGALGGGIYFKFIDYHVVVAADKRGFLLQHLRSLNHPQNELTAPFWVPVGSFYLNDLERIA